MRVDVFSVKDPNSSTFRSVPVKSGSMFSGIAGDVHADEAPLYQSMNIPIAERRGTDKKLKKYPAGICDPNTVAAVVLLNMIRIPTTKKNVPMIKRATWAFRSQPQKSSTEEGATGARLK